MSVVVVIAISSITSSGGYGLGMPTRHTIINGRSSGGHNADRLGSIPCVPVVERVYVRGSAGSGKKTCYGLFGVASLSPCQVNTHTHTRRRRPWRWAGKRRGVLRRRGLRQAFQAFHRDGGALAGRRRGCRRRGSLLKSVCVCVWVGFADTTTRVRRSRTCVVAVPGNRWWWMQCRCWHGSSACVCARPTPGFE